MRRIAKSLPGRFLLVTCAVLAFASAPVSAQEIRYSWLDMNVMGQDVDRMGNQTTPTGQTVDVNASDGMGIRFRGSIGTWNNFYLFGSFDSTDIDVTGTVFSILEPQGVPFEDEFDFTLIRGGVGYKWSILLNTDLIFEASYDSIDFDFAVVVDEDFDMGQKGLGGKIGVRHLLNDDFEVRLHGRFTEVGDADVTPGTYDSDTLFGAGFGWQVLRGLHIVGDYESGEFSNWSLGFRLDLDED